MTNRVEEGVGKSGKECSAEWKSHDKSLTVATEEMEEGVNRN